MRAVPAGSRRCRSQGAALAALQADPEHAALRSDFGRHVIEVYRVLVRHMDWRDSTSRPGRDNVLRAVVRTCTGRPISVSTWKRCRKWLEGHGYLGTVTPGWTAMLGPGVLTDAGEPSQAPVYVIAAPGRPLRKAGPPPAPSCADASTGPLTPSRREGGKSHRAGERTKDHEIDRAARGLASYTSTGPRWRLADPPENRGEGRLAAIALQDHAPVLRRLTPEHVRHLARPFWGAGWTPADVARALDYEPSGRQHIHTREVAHVAGWAAARLRLWIGPDGVPLPSASQVRATARAELAATAAAQRDATAAREAQAPAAAAAASRGAERIRQEAAARGGPFADALRRRDALDGGPARRAVAAADGPAQPGRGDPLARPAQARTGPHGPRPARPRPASPEER